MLDKFTVLDMKKISVIFLILLTSITSLAEPIHGTWRTTRIEGSPCSKLVEKLSYSFAPNGDYETHSWVRTPIGTKEMEAVGKYTVQGDMVTARVEGYTVGPYRFTVTGDELVIQEFSPPCRYYLERAK